MNIGIISDSEGYFFKESIKRHISSISNRIIITDLSESNEFERIEYSDLADKASLYIQNHHKSICILVDLTGSGITMYANKNQNNRAATCFNVMSTKEALEECNANMFGISSLTNLAEAELIVDLIINYFNGLE